MIPVARRRLHKMKLGLFYSLLFPLIQTTSHCQIPSYQLYPALLQQQSTAVVSRMAWEQQSPTLGNLILPVGKNPPDLLGDFSDFFSICAILNKFSFQYLLELYILLKLLSTGMRLSRLNTGYLPVYQPFLATKLFLDFLFAFTGAFLMIPSY